MLLLHSQQSKAAQHQDWAESVLFPAGYRASSLWCFSLRISAALDSHCLQLWKKSSQSPCWPFQRLSWYLCPGLVPNTMSVFRDLWVPSTCCLKQLRLVQQGLKSSHFNLPVSITHSLLCARELPEEVRSNTVFSYTVKSSTESQYT